MYCMKCGARLADTEIKCPLCGFDLPRLSPRQEKALFPRSARGRVKEDFRGLMLFVTLLLFGAGGACVAMDLAVGKGITYSAWVIFGLLLFYTAFLLPRWFRRPNPVIFFPVFFLCLEGCLWYLDTFFGSGWFLPVALPVGIAFLLFTEALATLLYYLHKGRLYIWGGYFLSLGALSFALELSLRAFLGWSLSLSWSLIPLILLSVAGLGLIVIAIVPSFRAFVGRRFFV